MGSFWWNGSSSGSGGFALYSVSSLTADTTVTTFEAYSLSFLLANDTTAPTVASTGSNSSTVASGGYICANATAVDAGGISTVAAMVTFPNSSVINFTMSDTGCGAGVADDTWFGVAVPAGLSAGTLTVNTTFANDSFNNAGLQLPHPKINVTVTSAGAFVDTTVNGSTLSFGSLDPGTSDNSGGAILLTNTANSNTAVDVYINNSDMASGANRLPYFNMSVHTANSPTASTALNNATFINGTSANTGFVENLAVSGTVNLYFWQDVPAGKLPGAYTGSVMIRSVADGDAP